MYAHLSLSFYLFSDTMDNLGAFITLYGKDMKPNFITYPAVVRFLAMHKLFLLFKYTRVSVALTLWVYISFKVIDILKGEKKFISLKSG